MYGDFSRLPFDRSDHDRGVLTFQGRLVLDQDLNRQWLISDYLRQRLAGDVIGFCGGPEDAAGFELVAVAGALEAGAGRYYVDGVLCENEVAVALDDQPHFPAAAPIVLLANGDVVTEANAPNGQYIAVLDRWTRLITPLQDPALKEVALGGADTAGVARTVWQIRLVAAGALGDDVHCLSEPAAWLAQVTAPDGLLRARAQPSTNGDGPCVVEAGAGYRRVSNQLYNVSVHQGGAPGTATFKWSRENGSVATRWIDSNGVNLVVEGIGRDRATGFAPGDWIELHDDDLLYQGLPGVMAQLVNAHDNILTIDPVTADGATDIAGFGSNPIIRRWEGDGVATIEIPAGNDGYIPLEDGVEVRFEEGTQYRSGDYWMIPARHDVNDIEWPRDQVSDAPIGLPPMGYVHAYCRLGIVAKNGAWSVVDDCRNLFPPLTRLISFNYLGGDGQEAPPDPTDPTALVPLPAPLRVGVARGTRSVTGRQVRFSVLQGAGNLGGMGSLAVVNTNADGVASIEWSLDGAQRDQRVVAELLDPAGTSQHLPIHFSATLSRAQDVSYDPANCARLTGMVTVQQAIDGLCQATNGGCTTYVVSPVMDWVALLSSLQQGENAHICFQRGDYQTAQTIELRGHGHISISGCGAGSRIFATRTETAIHAIGCRSFRVHDIAISTPDGVGAIGHVKHLNGSLTATGCPVVDVRDAIIQCGAGARHERSCLNIRPASFSDPNPTPLQQVVVTGNQIIAGFGQIGMLVTDASKVTIRDNHVTVAARPKSMTFEKLLRDPGRRKALANFMVSEAVIESRDTAGKDKTLHAGRFTAIIRSSVPEAEWRSAMRAAPPTDAQKASAREFGRYVEGLIADAAEESTRLPSYDRQLKQLRRDLGPGNFDRLDPVVRRNLLTSGRVKVKSFEELSGTERSNELVVDDRRMRFDSVVSDGDWRALVRVIPPRNLRTDQDLLAYAKKTARRIVVDEAFRRRFPSARAWFDSLKANITATGYQGIVCGGQHLSVATVEGNHVDGFLEGLRIGLSHENMPRGQFDDAGSISVLNNRLHLRLPFERRRGHFGLFVGHVRRLRLVGNSVVWAAGRNDIQRYSEAVRVWGNLGNFVMIKDNDLRLGEIGVNVRHTGIKITAQTVQWLAADNFAEAARPNQVIVAPEAMVKRNNKPT